MFSVRIISVDHYQSMPTPGLDVTYSQFRGTQVKQVPVIRIFGTTPTGQKTCLHVHGVFPYFYVPYDGSDESAARLMYQIAASLDKAINISLGHSNSNTHHVFKVVLVSGKPFYGYHSKEHQFLKVFLYNPLLLKRAVDLLQNGVICNRVFQPHEAHIPFILQFFIDYNLYGMNFIELKSVVYRIDVGSEENMNCDSVTLGKESLCEVEADAVATDILNRFSVSDELAVNPGLAAIWEDEKQRRGEGKEISQQESQPRPCRNPTISELLLKEKLKENLRMQGRNSGQRSVLQEIPYPAETQEGSNILNASTLDTHHMSSLELLTQSKHEESIVNEELVLSLTSTNDENALNSQDKSMVYMLVELAEMNAERRENQELLKTVIDQNIEDDSILGSQMVVENEEDETLQDATVGVEENQCQSSLNHVYDELLSEYEPLENQSNPSSHHGTEENCNKYADDNETMKTSESGVQWDDTFWDAITDEDIPQLDGANDILCNEEEDCTSIKTQLDNIEHSAENNSTEDKITDPVKSSSTAVWNSVKDNNWCSEIYDFSILQTDGMHSEGDNESDFGSVENTGNNLINILRGNPSLTSLEGSSADDLTCTINKSSCGNSVVVPRKEFENSCKKNIVSGVCIGRIDDSCDVKRNIWKDTSESDIYKADCKDDSHDYSTNTVPLSAVSISEIEGCENVCDGIVCSEPLCYDNLLETSQFDDNLSPSSFIEYQKVEPVVSSNKSTETVSPHREREYNTMISHRFQKGKLKIKFSFCNTKKLSRKLKKKTQKSCKSRLIHKAFNFIDYVTEDMISSYFTQIETLKQHQSNTRSKMDKGIINLSWSKISVEKPQWRKNRHKKNSILKIDMNMSLKADNLNINNFDSDIRELLPCGDPSVSSEHLHCDQASPVKNKCKEISPKCKIQNCDLKLKRQSEKNVTENIVSNKTCVVTVQQLTCDNINSILNHHQVKSPSLHALQQLRTSDSSTHELTMLKSITGSTSKSQLCKSSDTRSYQIEQTETHKTCKTESEKQLQTTLKVSLHEVLLSGPCSNMSGVNCLSSKFTQYHSVPEDIVEQCNKAVVIVDKLNAQNLANVHQSHSEGVTDSTAGTTGSPRKSQLNKSSDICQIEQAVSHKVCKTESDKQLKGALKVTLHKLQLSSSCSKYSSSTLYHSIPEKTIEQHDKSLAVVSQINDKSLANVVHQSQSAKSVTDRMSGINSCFVKLEKIDSCEERLKCNSKLQSENRNPDIELQGNIVSHKLCTKWNGITTVSKFCQKLKNIGKDNVSPYSEVKHERLVETSPNLEKPSTEDKDTSLRGRKCTRLNKKFSCKTLAVLCKKNILSTGFYLTKEINTLQHTNNETFVQVRNICESRRRTLRMSNFHNIQDNVKLEKNVRTLVLEKENKRLNEKASRISRSRQCMKHENTIPNIMCIDGTYDSSSSDSCDMSCDSQQNSSSKLIQTPKRHRRAQGCKKQATPKHRYKPLRIEIKKSPTSKCTSYEQKNSQQVGKLQAEFRVDVGKDNKDIRKAKNKRPAVENEPDTLTVYKTEGPKKVRVEQRSPVTSAASREKVVRNTRSAKKAECSPQKTIISCDMTDINRRGINDLHLKELRVCLQRLKFKNGKPVVVEENRRLTCGAISRLNNAQASADSTAQNRNTMTETVNIVAEEEESPSSFISATPSTVIQHLQIIKDGKKSETTLEPIEDASQHSQVIKDNKMAETTFESVGDASNKKIFCRARKRLHFPKYTVPTSQSTSDSTKKHHKNDISISVPSDSYSSTVSITKTQQISQTSQHRISVCDENLLPTDISNKNSNTCRKDHKSQDGESIVNNKNVSKTKKLYIPDYDAQPSTSHGVKIVFDPPVFEPLFTSPESVEKLSQSTNPSLTESNNILTSSYTNVSNTEFNAHRINSDCESDKGIISFYNRSTIKNMSIIEQNKDINCEKIVKLQGITKPNTTYTLSRKPPNRYEVCQELGKYGFPEVINEEPFVSNPADAVKGKEVGGKVLKLTSRSVQDLEEFESDLSILSKWQEKLVAEIFGSSSCEKKIFCSGSVLATDRHVIVTPLKQAPTVNKAKLWYSARLAIDDAEEELKEVKVSKIVVPSSPGHGVDEDETTISLTPSTCSSSATKASGQVEVVHSTPHASDNYRNCVSPVFTPIVLYDKICFKFKPDIEKKPRRRTSLMSHVDQDTLPLIVEEDDSTVVTVDDDSKTIVKDNSKTAIEDNSKTITEDISTIDCDQMIQDETSVKEGADKKEQKATVHTKQSYKAHLRRRLSDLSRISASASGQIDTVTPDNSGGYKMALENLQCARSVNQHQYLTVMSMELHVATRGDLRPDPEFDSIRGIFYHVINDAPEYYTLPEVTGVMIVGKSDDQLISSYGDEYVLHFADTEEALLHQFIQIVRKWDPDIFIGFEIEMLSWGFLIQRSYILSINMNAELSRIQAHASRPQKDNEDDAQSSTEKDHEIRLIGRIVLNGWRLFRHEIALQSYTFENLMYHILHRRIPTFSFHTLTQWWNHRTRLYRWMTVEHYVTRVVGTIKLLIQLDIFERTSELARLFGIQFYEVLSRGSQFRVESMMLRLAKPLNYVSVSPSIKQRAHMRAPGCLPLIMEPESRFYSDPVIVLDFQSLYPSMIIAYNYCFSTCMGRVEHLGQSEFFEFGCTQLRVPFDEIMKLEEELNFSPCGVAFVKPAVRKGILPRMLEEILNTRLMVKKSMKKYKDNKVLQRALESRQLGLKLIANVTYGYTAANFSGRMPCSEVGDSVVSKGRETLERAISLVKNTPKWGAEVVYGDTDSLFVMVPGKDRKEAFRIGAEIAEAVTNDNPPPVKLKLEKVFQPCILQTKKRYVGYMYESPDEDKPVYNAKGIETVRRDGCPAVAKILEKSLKLLFDTKDVSLVKNYATQQFSKILLGRLSVQELTFAREYRGALGYKPGACVPALELAKQWLAVDPRSEPRVGERVPYIVTAGPPGLPLIRSVRSPQDLLADPALKINTEYYITKVIIPPLDRCFSLIGAQVLSWYSELPRKQHTYLPSAEPVGVRKGTISQYFATVTCVICQEYTHTGVCSNCQKDPQKVAAYLADKLSSWERKYSCVVKLCQSCCGRSRWIDCTSLDCPVLYVRYQARKDLNQAPYVKQLQQDYLSF